MIHAPSFRVVLEEVWPKLEARVDAENAVLAMTPREMVKLALDHKHLTVKARTVNQRLYHQWCMDQFYWYVDEDTLIGYQWPVALVAIKPERVSRSRRWSGTSAISPRPPRRSNDISSRTPTISSCSSRKARSPARS